MRIVINSLHLARIAGLRAGLRHYRFALRLALAAYLDELSSLALLIRSKLLKGIK
jgi:hypothetical protein